MNSVGTGTRAGLAVSSLFHAHESVALDDTAARSSSPAMVYAAEHGSLLRSGISRSQMLRTSKELS